jgi:chromosomal replication initiation ATPase DnaA
MYLCQQLTGSPQKEIAEFFNLQSTGSVSYTTHMVRVKIRENKEFEKNKEINCQGNKTSGLTPFFSKFK